MAKRYPLKLVQGMPILAPFAENWERVESFQARADDLLISTYPKSDKTRSGTTWVSEIVDLILNGGDTVKTQRVAIFIRVPFLESAIPKEHNIPSGTSILNQMDSPRFIKTHLSVEVLPESFWEKNCKMIYVARNAKDVAVSYYYFYRMATVHPDPGTWEDFLKSFMEGNVAFGSWSAHVKGWWHMSKKRDILYLFYEDLLRDSMSEIKKIMKFLGKDLPEDVLEKINQHTSFQAMKDNPMTNYSTIPNDLMDQAVSPFMRKGICGDWKNHFTVSQNERFDEYYQREMSDTDLSFHF